MANEQGPGAGPIYPLTHATTRIAAHDVTPPAFTEAKHARRVLFIYQW